MFFQRRMWRTGNISAAALHAVATGIWMNVVEPILFRRGMTRQRGFVRTRIGAGACEFARRSTASACSNIGHRAVHHGIAPGQVCSDPVKDHIFHTALALGLMHVGAATVSVGTTLPPGVRVDVILTDTPQAFGNGNAKVVAVDLDMDVGQRCTGRGTRISRQRQ